MEELWLMFAAERRDGGRGEGDGGRGERDGEERERESCTVDIRCEPSLHRPNKYPKCVSFMGGSRL